MKKLIALFTVLLIVTGAAFAQIPDGLTIGGWSRSDFAVVQGQFHESGDNVFRTGVGSGWGPAYMGVVFTFAEAEGRIGGQAEIGWGNGSFQQGDALYAWAKPFASDILKIYIGSFNQEEFRGPGTDHEFDQWIGGPGKSGDWVFNRIAPRGGALFLSKPIEGFSIYASVNPGWNTLTAINTLSGPEANDIYKKIQAGIAYDIPGIGLARAQYVGDTMDVRNSVGTWAADLDNGNFAYTPPTSTYVVTPSKIEAAFLLKALEGLTLDIGIKLPLPIKKDDTIFAPWPSVADWTIQDNFQVNVAGNFKAGDFGVRFGLYSGFGGSVTNNDANFDRQDMTPFFQLTAGPNFYLAGLDSTIGVDASLKVVGEGDVTISWDQGAEKTTDFGFGAWISKDLGKGSIKTGVSFVFPTYKDNTNGTYSTLSWPIILELSY
jgi:hypothetical protein